MTGYLLEIKNEIALIFCYRKIKTFYYIVQHGISGYGFLQKPPLKLLRNFRYAETLYEIKRHLLLARYEPSASSMFCFVSVYCCKKVDYSPEARKWTMLNFEHPSPFTHGNSICHHRCYGICYSLEYHPNPQEDRRIAWIYVRSFWTGNQDPFTLMEPWHRHSPKTGRCFARHTIEQKGIDIGL